MTSSTERGGSGSVTSPHSGTGPEVTRFVVTVMVDPTTPVPNAYVEIIVGQPLGHYICPSAQAAGITNEQGQVTFNLAMGGCSLGPGAVRIRANGVRVRAYERLISPDFTGEGDGRVGISDLVFFGSG